MPVGKLKSNYSLPSKCATIFTAFFSFFPFQVSASFQQYIYFNVRTCIRIGKYLNQRLIIICVDLVLLLQFALSLAFSPLSDFFSCFFFSIVMFLSLYFYYQWRRKAFSFLVWQDVIILIIFNSSIQLFMPQYE